MKQLKINARVKVKKGTIDERQYLVVPLVMLKEGVLNGSKGALFYPKQECSKNIDAWNGMPIVLNHPVGHSGEAVSARNPEVLNSYGIGQVFNASWQGRLKAEAWIDIEKANKVDTRIVSNLRKNKAIEISTGLFTNDRPTKGKYNGIAYNAIATDYKPDHLAVLLDTPGACSLKDGCGLLVNGKRKLTKNTPGRTDSDGKHTADDDYHDHEKEERLKEADKLTRRKKKASKRKKKLSEPYDEEQWDEPGYKDQVKELKEGIKELREALRDPETHYEDKQSYREELYLAKQRLKELAQNNINPNMKGNSMFKLGTKLSEKDREGLAETVLTANCSCDGSSELAANVLEGLDAMTDNQLILTANGYTKKAKENTEDEDEEEEKEMENTKGKDKKPVKNGGDMCPKCEKATSKNNTFSKKDNMCKACAGEKGMKNNMDTESWLADAPLEIRNVVQNALALEKQQKQEKIDVIVANVNNKFSSEFLQELELDHLSGIAELATNSVTKSTPAVIPMFTGQQGGLSNNSRSGSKIEPLVSPVINYGSNEGEG